MNKFMRLGAIIVAVIVATFVLAVGGTASMPMAHAQEPKATTAVAWATAGNRIGNTDFLGSTNKKALVLKTANLERMRIDKDGKVGIGTDTPLHQLQIGGGFDGNLGIDGSDATPDAGFIRFGDNTGWKLFLGRQRESSGAPLNTGTTGAIMTIADTTQVGIGTTSPGATLEVKGPDTSASTLGFVVNNSDGLPGLFVYDDRTVGIGALAGSTTTHVCLNGDYFSSCSSAAEYVPSIDGGKGFPETADLVSIAPTINNPYGDKHGPFTVQKSTTACDTNLLGYIVKPESGADGPHLNNHYLPLSIFGYFPAKVTMENGTIKRGDPITSSSKAGYGMKATGACKVIGYALEDATLDGTIQVFAHFGENAASEVAALRGQVDALTQQNLALTQENSAFKQQLTSIAARLAALEQTAPLTRSTTEAVLAGSAR